MVTNLWQSLKGFSVMPQKSQLSAPQYSKMSYNTVQPSEIPEDWNRVDSSVRSALFTLQGWSVRLLKTLSTTCLQTSPERRKNNGYSPYLAWATFFNERLGWTSFPDISKRDQEQQHNDHCWLFLLLGQFQREKGQWSRECPSPHMQWPSCHGAPSHKLHCILNFQENINRAKIVKFDFDKLTLKHNSRTIKQVLCLKEEKSEINSVYI